MDTKELDAIMKRFDVPPACRVAVETAYRLGYREMGIRAFGVPGMIMRPTNASGGVAAAPRPGYVLDETGTVRKVSELLERTTGLTGGSGTIPDSQF